MDRDDSARTLRDHYREAAIAANLNRGRTPSPPRSMLGQGLDQDITTASMSRFARHFVRDEFGLSANTAQHIGDGVALVAGAGLAFGQVRGLRGKPAANFSGSRVPMPGQGFRVQRGPQPTQSGLQVLSSRRQDVGVGHGSGRVPAQRAHSAVAKRVEKNITKLLWSSWSDYPKVVLDGKEYARIGDRLYTRHAVDRMLPSGLGAPAGTQGAGRSFAPNFIEQVIRDGTKQTELINGVERTHHILGKAKVVTERNGEIVVTVNPFSGGN